MNRSLVQEMPPVQKSLYIGFFYDKNRGRKLKKIHGTRDYRIRYQE